MRRYSFLAWLLSLLCCLGTPVSAQTAAQKKSAWRYEIDAKRSGVEVMSEDALPRSREFLRLDSSYYVGWMFEGIYKANHAADYLGYKNAVAPLERALANLERDYKKELSTRSSDLVAYYPAFRFQFDYSQIAYSLYTCYSNIEEADKVYALLRRVLGWKFQKDFFIDPYNHLGWIVHRNRFYTAAKYPFLEDNITDNEKLAHRYLDSGMTRIQRNFSLNAPVFGAGYEAAEKMSVYHYKSILYGYALQIDSTEHYYQLMRGSANFPHNNYGNFKNIIGAFREAEAEYQKAAVQDPGDKRLHEWAYYTSLLHIFKGQPEYGIALMKDMIRSAGSTPGFGWYNIALARACYYNGSMDDAKMYIEKAAGFKELHIGTTLGQSHYDFAVQLQKLVQQDALIEMERFEHRNWWYNPRALATMAGRKAERFLQQFLIINQLAQNPERDRVIYKLFSTESVVSWDEVWYLIKDFSSQYFLQRFQEELKTDPRPFIQKYFGLFVARLEMQRGHYERANTLLRQLLTAPDTDIEYEKLYAARVLEAQAQCAYALDKEDDGDAALQQLYETYPQLIPFSGIEMKMQLAVQGADAKSVTKALQACRIQFTAEGGWPKAIISYRTTGNIRYVEYRVIGSSGREVVAPAFFSYNNAEEAGRKLAYRLFKMGLEKPMATPQEGS